MSEATPIECATCAETGLLRQATVGVGSTPRWVCQEHFVEYLSQAKQTIANAWRVVLGDTK